MGQELRPLRSSAAFLIAPHIALIFTFASCLASWYMRRRWLHMDLETDVANMTQDGKLRLTQRHCLYLRWGPVGIAALGSTYYLIWVILANTSSGSGEIILGTRSWL